MRDEQVDTDYPGSEMQPDQNDDEVHGMDRAWPKQINTAKLSKNAYSPFSSLEPGN